MLLEHSKKLHTEEFPGGLAVKDSMLPLLWLEFDHWPRIFCVLQAQPKKKKKAKQTKQNKTNKKPHRKKFFWIKHPSSLNSSSSRKYSSELKNY